MMAQSQHSNDFIGAVSRVSSVTRLAATGGRSMNQGGVLVFDLDSAYHKWLVVLALGRHC